MENVVIPRAKQSIEIAVDSAIDYDGPTIVARVRPELALGAGFSSATLGGEVANSVFIALNSSSLEQARAWEGAELIHMPPTKQERAKFLDHWAKKVLKKNQKGRKRRPRAIDFSVAFG